MKNRIKKLVALVSIGTMLLSALPVSAASKTLYGHTMNYSSSKVNNKKATASTSCSNANSVDVQLTVYYNRAGVGQEQKQSSNTSRVATSTSITLTGDVTIISISGYHKAIVSQKSVLKTIEGYS